MMEKMEKRMKKPKKEQEKDQVQDQKMVEIPEEEESNPAAEPIKTVNDSGTDADTGKDINAVGGKGQKTVKLSARKLLSSLLVIAGIGLITVPLIVTYINTKRNEDIIDKFLNDAQMAAADSQAIAGEEIEDLLPSVPPATTDANNPAGTASPEPGVEQNPVSSGSATATPEPQPAGPTKKPLMSAEEIQKRMTGVLIIKKIDLRMVIMDGVDDETLRVAAGRMPETGNFDEIGNVVLAGHRSYTFGKYFNRLDELAPGDEIIVQTKAKTLKYTIYSKFVVEPDDLSITNRNDTDKILTLFTCTPVVIADHRLVVQAKQSN